MYINSDVDLLDLLIDVSHHFVKLNQSSPLDFLQQCYMVVIDITELITSELEVFTHLVFLCNESSVNLKTKKVNEQMSVNTNLRLC